MHLNKIKTLIEGILYTLIFCVTKNNTIQKKLFALYVSKVTISNNEIRLIPKLDYHLPVNNKHDPNFGLTFQDNIAKELFISKKNSNIKIKTLRHKWQYPIEYPPKLKIKNKESPLLNIITRNEKETYISDFIKNYTNNSRSHLIKLTKVKTIPKNKKVSKSTNDILVINKPKNKKVSESTNDILVINKPKNKKLIDGNFDIVMTKKMKNLLKEWPIHLPKKRIIKPSTTWYDFFFCKKIKYIWDPKLERYVIFKKKLYTWNCDLERYVISNEKHWISNTPFSDWWYNYNFKKLKLNPKGDKLINIYNKKITKDLWVQDYIVNKKSKNLSNNVLHNCEQDIQTLFYTKDRFLIGDILSKKAAWVQEYNKSLLHLPTKNRTKIVTLDNPEWDFVKLTKGKPLTLTQNAHLKDHLVPWTELKVTRWKWLSDHLFSVKLYKKQRRTESWIHQQQSYKSKKKLDIALKEREYLINLWKTKQAKKEVTKNNINKDSILPTENSKNQKDDITLKPTTFLEGKKTTDREVIINTLDLNTPKRSNQLPQVIYTIKGPRNKLEMLKKLPRQNANIVDIREPFTTHKLLPDGTKKKIHVFRHTKAPSETVFRYFDLKDTESSLQNFKSDQGLAWREIWNPISYLVDQYFYAVPIFIMFLFIHWTLAEIILSKFKCQQHYKWNTALFTSGFLLATYFYIIFNSTNKGFFFYGAIPETTYSPLYSTLYIWWIFLMSSFVIIFIFTLFTPKTPYLRGKNIIPHGDMIFNLLPSLIGLFMVPIVAQRRLPFWSEIEILFLNNFDKVQYHFGYIYILFIWILMGLTSVAFFYYIVTIDSYIKYKASKDKSYIEDIIYLLFSEQSDDTDLWTEVGGEKGVPYHLVQYMEDFATTREGYEVPDGYYYYCISYLKFSVAWQSSYSKKVFLLWYATMAMYYTLIYQLYFVFEWPTLFVFTFFFWLILASLYLIFIKFILGFNIIRKKRHQIMFFFFIIFLCFIFVFFSKDFLFFFGIK